MTRWVILAKEPDCRASNSEKLPQGSISLYDVNTIAYCLMPTASSENHPFTNSALIMWLAIFGFSFRRRVE